MCYDINCGHPDCSTIVRIPCENLNYCRKVDMSQRGWQSVGPDPELCEEHLPWDYKTGARGKATVRWHERYNKMRRSDAHQTLDTKSKASDMPCGQNQGQQAIAGPLNGPLDEREARPSANPNQEDLQSLHGIADKDVTSQRSSLEAFEAVKAGAKRFRQGQFHPYDNPYANHKRQQERNKGSGSLESISKKDVD